MRRKKHCQAWIHLALLLAGALFAVADSRASSSSSSSKLTPTLLHAPHDRAGGSHSNKDGPRRRRSENRRRRSPLFWGGSSSASSSSYALPRSSLPRSKNRASSSSSSSSPSLRQRLFPPWNLSEQIDDKGFLKTLYRRVPGDWEPEVKLRTSHGLSARCRIRQVPGDGNCLFHSISLCLRHAVNGTHWKLDGAHSLDELYRHSHELRQQAVQCLGSTSRRLFLQGRESLRATDLVQAAAAQYHLTPDEYCECMSQSSVWGGGPEIVALCNLLQRPIHVYELATAVARASAPTPSDLPRHGLQQQLQQQQHDLHQRYHQYQDQDHFVGDDGDAESTHQTPLSSSFVLRRMACFGSPKFDHRRPLHILSADSRFPDVPPGQQLTSGNHFLAVFPAQRRRGPRPASPRRSKLRGGAASGDDDEGRRASSGGGRDVEGDEEEDYEEYDVDYDGDDADGWEGDLMIVERSQDGRHDHDHGGGEYYDPERDGDDVGATMSLSGWMRSWCGRLLGRRSPW